MLFLLVSSDEDAATHLAVLKKIALLVENPEFYAEACAAADAETVYRIIRAYENILDAQEE